MLPNYYTSKCKYLKKKGNKNMNEQTLISENVVLQDSIKETRGVDLDNPEEVLEEKINVPMDGMDENLIISQEYVDKTLQEIEEMNFIETQKFIREVKYQQNNLVSAKDTAENFLVLKNQMDAGMLSEDDADDFSSKIEESNAEVDTGVEDVQTFLDNYEDTKEKMQIILDAAENHLHIYDDVKKTTSFLSEEMLKVLEKNRDKIDDSNPMYKTLRIYYKEVMNVFQNRTSTEWIEQQLPSTKIEVGRLQRDLKKDTTGTVMSNVQKRVAGSLYSMFSAAQLNAFENFLTDLYKDMGGSDLAFYVQYALFLVYNKEKTNKPYGKHKWVEAAIMNVLDVKSDVFDLEGGPDVIKEGFLRIGNIVKEITNL